MISANFFNFDAAGNNLPTETTGNNFSEKDFASFFDQMFVYPTNAQLPFQNSAPAEMEILPELMPICVTANNAGATAKEVSNELLLPNPMETSTELPQILNSPGKQTPLDAPVNPKAGIIAKDLPNAPVETPPILPEQQPNPVETPPIFEQQNSEKPVLLPHNTQKPFVKSELPVQTPPIIVQPQTTVSQSKPVTPRTNTKKVESNTEETPPIAIFPEYANASPKIEKTFSTVKSEYLNASAKTENAGSVNKPENNIARPEDNISKPEIKNQVPPILTNTDKTAGIKQKDWNTARSETATLPELNMIQQVLNLAKTNGKAIRRELTETVNSTVTNGKNKDYTPILIPNENISLNYSVQTENYDGSGEKPTKLQNILFNMIESNAADSAEQNGFGKIDLQEFQINETAKNPAFSKNETGYATSATNGETAELIVEANAELFTKSVFPKRKSMSSVYEAASIIRGEENLNAKFEMPQGTNTPNILERAEIPKQVEVQMTQLAVKVEQTKETQILKMRLHPAELGTVEIHLEKNANGQLQAHLSTESETARTALHENIDQLRNTLEKAGWQVSAVEVTTSTASTNQFSGSRNNGENHPNDFYQSFSKAENTDNLSQTESSEKDDLQHIVSLRA